MECLPEEMVLMISRQLSVQELAACCAVSHSWRDLFNRDVFWRQRCDAALAVHLRDTKCIVEPCFESPEVEGSGLSPVCECRLSCMRQAHLHNNWVLGRFNIVFTKSSKSSGYPIKVIQCSTFYEKNEFLIAHSSFFIEESNTFYEALQLWDIEDYLDLLSEYKLQSIPCPYLNVCNELNVYKDQVVLRRDGLILLFTISNLEFKFKCTLQLNDSEILQELTVLGNANDEKNWSQQNWRRKLIRCAGVQLGQIYLAIQEKPKLGRKLHVWNLEMGEKIKEEEFKNSVLYEIKKGGGNFRGNKVVLNLLQLKRKISKIVVYNTTQLALVDFSLQFNLKEVKNIFYELHDNYIIVNSRGSLDTYNFVTNQLVKSISIGSVLPLYTLGDGLVFNYNDMMYLFKLKSLEMQPLLSNKLVYEADVLCDKFIFINFFTGSNSYALTSFELSRNNYPIRTFHIPLIVHSSNTFGTKFFCLKFHDSIAQNEYLFTFVNYW